MKKLFYLLFMTSHVAYGQQTANDSLVQLLNGSRADTQRLNILNQLSNNAIAINAQLAMQYARQGVKLAETANLKNWEFKLLETQGRMHANLLQLDSAVILYEKARKGYTIVNDRKGLATLCLKFAWIYKRKGEFEKALAEDLQGLRIMEELKDNEGIATAYEKISDDLTRQERFSEALDYANKSLEFCDKYDLKNQKVSALFNAGAVAIAMNNNEEALSYFNKTLALATTLNFSLRIKVPFMISRGNSLKRLGKYELALKDYNECLRVSKQTNYVMGISTAIANLGETNILLGNFKDALGYQLETVRLQEKNGDLTNLTENYAHVSHIYEKLGDYKSALDYQKKARLMRDSVSSIKSDTAMSKLLTQYQTEKKEATISSQNTQILQQRKVQWLSIGIALLLAGFLVFAYRNLRHRNKSNKLLAAKNAENELLLKEIHHRVKNNLEVVSSLLALQSAQIDDPNTKEAMLEGQNRVHSIGIVHQKLYQGENPGAIEMKDYFLNLSESILDSFGAIGRVSIELAMEKIDIDIDTAVPLGLIVNELLTNTLKYAFPNHSSGAVCIKLEKQSDGMLHLEFSDNGIGKSAVIHGTGFGAQLINILTRQLNGSMKEEIRNGTHTFFHFRTRKLA